MRPCDRPSIVSPAEGAAFVERALAELRAGRPARVAPEPAGDGVALDLLGGPARVPGFRPPGAAPAWRRLAPGEGEQALRRLAEEAFGLAPRPRTGA